jgi:hypothetical protein
MPMTICMDSLNMPLVDLFRPRTVLSSLGFSKYEVSMEDDFTDVGVLMNLDFKELLGI